MRMLVCCLPVPGHLGPHLALAQVLRARGHEVAVYSGASAREAVEGCGLRFVGFDPDMDRQLTGMIFPPQGSSGIATAGDRARAALRPKRIAKVAQAWLLGTAPQQLRDIPAFCAAFRPDVIVCDLTVLGPILVLKDTMSVPVAVFCVIPECPIPGPSAPPWGRGIPRPATALARARVALERRVIDWIMGDARAAANDLRRANGLPPLAGRIADEYGRVPLFMVAGAPEFDYARDDLPVCVHYVGPCTLADDGTAPPEWLRSLPPSPPVVHVTEGTVHGDPPIVLRAAAAGLAGGPFQVVLSTGGHRRPEDLDLPVAPNIRVEQIVSHHHLLPKTHVLVTTGSAGTVTRALMAGVPIVIVPIGWEHPETAQRIVETGVGLRLDPRRCTPKRLRAAVERVLGEPAYRTNARRLGDALGRQGGPARAADLIERLAGSAQSMRPKVFVTPAIGAQNPNMRQ